MTCTHCGSSRHRSEHCPIKRKADLLKKGVPAEELFYAVMEVKKSDPS